VIGITVEGTVTARLLKKALPKPCRVRAIS
jgi:hypothetical protein